MVEEMDDMRLKDMPEDKNRINDKPFKTENIWNRMVEEMDNAERSDSRSVAEAYSTSYLYTRSTVPI